MFFGRDDVKSLIGLAQEAYEAFLWLLETYEFPLQDGQTYGGATASIPQDPAGRRDAKIKQFKMERALKEKVSVSTMTFGETYTLTSSIGSNRRPNNLLRPPRHPRAHQPLIPHHHFRQPRIHPSAPRSHDRAPLPPSHAIPHRPRFNRARAFLAPKREHGCAYRGG